MFNLQKIFNLKKMKNKNGSKPRKIDESVEKTSESLSSQFALVSKMQIKAWKAYLALFFMAGLATAIIFSVQTNIQTKSSAKSTKPSQTEELAQIQKAIKDKKAKWVAKDNSIFRLSNEEKKKRANAKIPSASEVQQNYSPPSGGITPPATLDWRNNNGNFVTPVRNQGNCGSCWAFGSTAALESYTLIKDNKPGTNLDLSEQVAVSCSGGGSCSGGYHGTTSEYFKNTGIPVESCYPYTATNGVCTSACANWQASAYKIGSWSYITTSSTQSSLPALKQAIASGPIATGFAVYSDFTSYGSGIYSYTSGSFLGNHIVEIVGYDDAGQYFIAKNSWGSGWGEGGYFRIAYSEVGGTSQFGMYSIDYSGTPAPAPTGDTTAPTANITSPTDGSTASGTTTVAASANDNVGVSKVQFYMDNTLQSSDTSSPYSFSWNTAAVANGAHTLSAKASDAAGNMGTSTSVGVNVSNAPQPPDTIPPTVSLTSPSNSSTFTKNMKINASGSDNVKVVSTRAMIDGNQTCSSTTGALSCTVSLAKKFAKGSHTVTIEAADAAGNKGTATANVTFK